MDKTIAHLGFIQAIITRMGSNSFMVKGWTVALVAAVFALAAKDTNSNFILIAYFPVVVFWILDSYYLHQERMYRMLYEAVAEHRVGSDKFTLDASQFQKQAKSLTNTFLSKTVLGFYGPIVALILFAMFFIL